MAGRLHDRLDDNGRVHIGDGAHDPSLTELLKRLGAEAGDLVRSEVALAKVELSQSARMMARDGVRLVIALGLAWVGLLALTAALIAGLGALLGAVWTAALIVGFAYLLIGGLLAQRGLKGLQENSLKPDATVRSLERDRNWAKREVRELREGIRR